MTKANGANFWEEMSSAGVGKNEEKNDNLSSSDVIVFPHILSNTGSQLAAEAEASSGYIFSCNHARVWYSCDKCVVQMWYKTPSKDLKTQQNNT